MGRTLNMNTITEAVRYQFKDEITRLTLEEYRFLIGNTEIDVDELTKLYKDYVTDVVEQMTEDTSQLIIDLIPLDEVQWLLLAEELLEDITHNSDHVVLEEKESEDLLP